MKLAELTWPMVDDLDRSTPIVLPIAALEQHGHHLPVFTDSLLLGEVLRRVELDSIANQVLIAPLQWFGNSHHHMDMPGTMSATPRTYLDLLRDEAECFLGHGFQRIVFINGHGGNITPSQQAVYELRQKYRERNDLLLLSLTYWDSADPTLTVPNLTQRAMGHAGEWETSMILAAHPELVRGTIGELAEIPAGAGASPGYRGWIMPDRSEPGYIGNPAAATSEKGEALLKVFAAGVVEFLQRVVDWDGERWELSP